MKMVMKKGKKKMMKNLLMKRISQLDKTKIISHCLHYPKQNQCTVKVRELTQVGEVKM